MRTLALLVVFVLPITGCQCAGSATTQQACSTTVSCPAGYVCVNSLCAKTDGGAGGGATGGGAGGGTGGGNPFDAGSAHITGLLIEPATATLVSSNGSQPIQQFVAKVTLDDGTSSLVDAVFSSDPRAPGDIDPIGGRYVANGQIGGRVDVKAAYTYGGVTYNATAVVTVKIDWVSYGTDFDPGTVPRFQSTPVTDPLRAPNVVYPPDAVVFPQNVAPPDVQWLNGSNSDLFRLVFRKSDITFTAYAVDRGDHHYLPDAAPWRALAQTNPLESATLDVVRWENNTSEVIPSPQVRMKFARAALTGSVYYWDIAAGRIVRIDDGTTMRTNIMPNPPVALDGNRCVGCHVVGASGRYMSGRLGGGENIGGIFDLTVNLTPDPAPTVWPTSVSPSSARWWFSSFNPDETRMVVSLDETGAGGMGFLDPRTGGNVSVSGVPPGKVTHVAWAPDGKSIAYVDNFGTWGGDFTVGDVSVVPVTGQDALGAPTRVHLGASLSGSVPAGSADSYPTWTPDSKRIAFAHGSGCRSESHAAALFVMNADGSSVTRLTNASGGASGTSSFQPRFSPFQADGYFWLTFLSRRDYGNDRVGTRGADRQQIWVAAVKVNAQPGEDPSEVAYWLPGQNTASRNIAAYWAPRACRTQGQMCTVGSECCSGECSNGVCSPPPPERCRLGGETCGATGDCCPNRGLVCKQNTCQVDIQ